MSDAFIRQPVLVDDPIVNAFAITPSDVVIFSQPTRALWVGAAGNIQMMFSDKYDSDNVVTISGINAGTLLPFRVKMIYATNTTASGIVGLY